MFEGDAAAELERSSAVDAALRGEFGRPNELRLWLGEPLAIAEPTSITLRRQAGSNVLVVGRDEDVQCGLVAAMILSVAAQRRESTDIRVFDFTGLDRDASVLLAQLGEAVPGFQVLRRRQVEAAMRDLAAEVRARVDGSADAERPILVVLHGFGRARDFDPDASSYDSSEQTLSDQLGEILKDGPEVAVHVVATADSLKSLERRIDRRSLREFSLRIALRMGAEDSSHVLDTPAAQQLRDSQALLSDEDDARLEKFRYYGRPSNDWLRIVGSLLVTANEAPADGPFRARHKPTS